MAKCERCAEFGGGWRMAQDGSGLVRCECTPAPPPVVPRPPVVSEEEATLLVEMLENVPFLPASAGARGLISDQLRVICAGPNEALWLVRRMVALFPRRWPGVEVMRTVYCSRYIPLDGVPASTIAADYPDGIPSERETSGAPLAIDAAPMRRLTAGAITEDAQLGAEVRRIAAQKTFDRRKCCSDCRQTVGAQHLPSCHRQGVVTPLSVYRPLSDQGRRDADFSAALEATLTPPDQRKEPK